MASQPQLVRVATCSLNQWALDFDGNLARVLASARRAKELGATYRVGPELELTGYGCEDHFYEPDTYAHALESLAAVIRASAPEAAPVGLEAGPSAVGGGGITGIVLDVGTPIMHRGLRYNARVLILDGHILLVRPKLCLADDGNYRESRWFTAYSPPSGGSAVAGDSSSSSSSFSSSPVSAGLEEWSLPPIVAAATYAGGGGGGTCGASGGEGEGGKQQHQQHQQHHQTVAPFGIAMIESQDGVTIAPETCEELFTPQSPHIALGLAGCDIFSNGSGSHHQLRKLHTRIDLMRGATGKGGGVYLYANQRGCDGGRLYFDGCAAVMVNGECVGQGAQFGLRDVEVVCAVADLDDVRSLRAASASRGQQASASGAGSRVARVRAPLRMVVAPGARPRPVPSAARPVRYHTPEEEVGLGPACWLWDFLRRSGAGGYLLPLSGGADSASVCAIVGIMCHLVFEATQREKREAEEEAASVAAGGAAGARAGADAGASAKRTGDTTSVAADLARVCRVPSPLPSASAPSSSLPSPQETRWYPASPAEVAHRVLHTVYMGTDNSTGATRRRAEELAAQVGSYHSFTAIDVMVRACLFVLATFVSGGRTPRFESRGGTRGEDLALQNLQARLRMVLAYLLAQLLPWLRSTPVPPAPAAGATGGGGGGGEGVGGVGAGGGGGGFLLVLGSANVDEALRGYMTKYDCSSADLNPIGAVSKQDLRAFLVDASARYSYPALRDIVLAPPTAELRPLTAARDPFALEGPPAVESQSQSESTGCGASKPVAAATPAAFVLPAVGSGGAASNGEEGKEVGDCVGDEVGAGGEHNQLDEADMGMTYEELSWFGRLRKVGRCGPLSMYRKLLSCGQAPWAGLPPSAVAAKVKRFFVFYGINRHKLTVLTPSYHAEGYSPDDNRHDLRPFLYPAGWARGFAAIDADVAQREGEGDAAGGRE